jgi:hypothetical protein
MKTEMREIPSSAAMPLVDGTPLPGPQSAFEDRGPKPGIRAPLVKKPADTRFI